MIAKRRMNLMWRWGLVGVALTALFWGAWYVAAGSIPESSFSRIENSAFLSVMGSRWLDIPAAFIWFALVVLLIQSREMPIVKEPNSISPMCLFVALFLKEANSFLYLFLLGALYLGTFLGLTMGLVAAGALFLLFVFVLVAMGLIGVGCICIFLSIPLIPMRRWLDGK